MSFYDDVHAEYLSDARNDPDPRPVMPAIGPRCPRCNRPVKADAWQCGSCGVDMIDLRKQPTGEDAHLEMAYEDRYGDPDGE